MSLDPALLLDLTLVLTKLDTILDKVQQDIKWEVTEGSLTMDGSEKTLYESTTKQTVVILVDLDPMDTGDTICQRQYLKVRSAGQFKGYYGKDYSGVNGGLGNYPCLVIAPKICPFGVKVSLQQTVGTNRTIDYAICKRL